MLRHIGEKRTNAHNVKLAGLLSLTAGSVNAAGYLSFMVLTTNVTGHVALFAESLAAGNGHLAWVIGSWMLSFFLGAFVCSTIIDIAYTLPIIIELIILLLAANNLHWFMATQHNNHFIAGTLLFAMGLQNAMVSMISGSVVRTTHLTGMFTDLGIEVAGLLFWKSKRAKGSQLYNKIFLRLIIIVFFLTGCIVSAYIFKYLNYRTFYIPAALLLMSMMFDVFGVKTIRLYYKLKYSLPGHTK
jgi:uncharacterized membrane protein YoaK (UPF0700 family)